MKLKYLQILLLWSSNNFHKLFENCSLNPYFPYVPNLQNLLRLYNFDVTCLCERSSLGHFDINSTNHAFMKWSKGTRNLSKTHILIMYIVQHHRRISRALYQTGIRFAMITKQFSDEINCHGLLDPAVK